MQGIKLVMSGMAGLALVAAAVWSLRPDPLLVDLVAVTRGPMEVTVEAEGVTRVRETWSVTAPIAGTVARSPVREGDAVVRDETEVALIRPADPPLLDARARAQAEAAVTEAQAAVRQAEVVLAQAQTDEALARAQLDRNVELARRGIIPQRALEDAEQKASAAAAALDSARAELDLHRATLARMQAQLSGPETAKTGIADGECCLRLRAPQSGTVLLVTDLNARPVQQGDLLVTIADLQDLQIEADLLSSDAVRVTPGAPVHVERWGGAGTLEARVERIDPTGFTKVSALGIEEQRVLVHMDFVTPPAARAGLGDGYRVFVRVAVWQADAILQVPQSALFRQGTDWAVFKAVAGRAVLAPVSIGQSQGGMAEVLSGLAEGDLVIAYPGNRISEGARIEARAAP
ncbi:efflux RND transporter periplasmic adaptor subunit [Rhodobacter sp. Har01]|uniref:efflux RND transporter periplasmic adaptor subunit n=1 Tax=Rhodobacter sp. Har01 TaxID=2883999 RepID=UPI001D05EF17|nr:HlyD family efflux transporter periplasmic adaptor subunit [Rhodobacter sp. Har01]MCB6176734.1 efflux RND transporter periplasmic adaptor subunit [Rhodobacter sp. Har01]